MKSTGRSAPFTTFSRYGLTVGWYTLVPSTGTPVSTLFFFYYIKITLICHGNVHPGFSDIRTGIATACLEQKRRII